jgi:hypothetical protein
MGFESIFESLGQRVAKRPIGTRQHAIGKMHKLFIEKFLGQFDQRHRSEIEKTLPISMTTGRVRRHMSFGRCAIACIP